MCSYDVSSYLTNNPVSPASSSSCEEGGELGRPDNPEISQF